MFTPVNPNFTVNMYIKVGCNWSCKHGQAASVEKMFENGGHMHVYSPGAGADNPMGSKKNKNINIGLNIFISFK